MSAAGFRLACSGVHDLSELSFVARRRWIGVYLNTLHVHRWDALAQSLSVPFRAPEKFQPEEHCLGVFTQGQRQEVTISEEEYDLLNEPGLLPLWTRGSPGVRCGALPFRVQSAGMVWPAITSAYRSACEFPRDHLAQSGLMTWVIRDSHGDIRWASCFEACIALGFPATMIMPCNEVEAFQMLGEATSPLQAALALAQAERVCAQQQGDVCEDIFTPMVHALRNSRASMPSWLVTDYGLYHKALQNRRPRPQPEVRCPHCGETRRGPLLLACKDCCMLACAACLAERCHPSHYMVVQGTSPAAEMRDMQPNVPEVGVAAYVVEDVTSGLLLHIDCADCPTIAVLLLRHELPSTTRFFLHYELVSDDCHLDHGDHVFTAPFPRDDDACPRCLTYGMSGQLRLCALCKRIGCTICVADRCTRCTGGRLACRACHEQKAGVRVRAIHEEVAMQQEDHALPILPHWNWQLRCDIEAEWELITAINYPVGRATIRRAQFYDVTYITAMIRHMGYVVEDRVRIYWGDSTYPDLRKATESYILVVPEDEIEGGRVPVVCQTPQGEVVKMCRPTQSGVAWRHDFLTEAERREGFKLMYRQQPLQDPTVVTLKAGDVLRKVPSWTEAVRHLEAPDEGLQLLEESLNLRPAAQVPTAGLGGSTPGTITPWCGVVLLNGVFQILPLPWPGQTWADWVSHLPLPSIDSLWGTVEGRPVPHDQPLEGRPILLRLHVRARGGAGKPAAKLDGLVRKLTQHLQTKGVPESEAQARATLVLDTLGQASIEKAYASTDPWRALKAAAGNRLRLVKPEELKATKGKPPSSLTEKGEDPWLLADPWQQATSSGPPRATITLVPGFFLDQEDQPLPILSHLTAEAKGVALVGVDEVQTYASANLYLSEDELAAVVISPRAPESGSMPSQAISFAAMHGDHKVLLRGFIINFGQKAAKTREAAHRVNLQLTDTVTLALEIRKEFQANWDAVTRNPLRFVWNSIDGLQRATTATWSRRFFSGRKECGADIASTWHMFAKLADDSYESFLRQSGKNGVFVTPKTHGAVDITGRFRIIWLEHADLDRAMTIQRTYPEIIGLVRGRDTLGVRVKAADYAAVRQKLEPHWSSQGILTDLIVERKWTMAPLPAHSDKAAIQKIVNELRWRAVPLKQLSATVWLIGAAAVDEPPTDVFEFAGKPVLITNQAAKRVPSPEQLVLAAPPAFRRSFATDLARGKWQAPATMPDPGMEVAPGPPITARSLMAEFKEEMNSKLSDFQSQVQSAVNQVNARVQEVQTAASSSAMELEALVARQDHRMAQVESNVQQLSAALVTKADLTAALAAAMESQNRELRSFLAKRSPDATPTGDSKAPRTS